MAAMWKLVGISNRDRYTKCAVCSWRFASTAELIIHAENNETGEVRGGMSTCARHQKTAALRVLEAAS